MPKAFLSHKYEEKTEVKKIQKYLTQCLVETWLDETNLKSDPSLWGGILNDVNKCQYFIPFLGTDQK